MKNFSTNIKFRKFLTPALQIKVKSLSDADRTGHMSKYDLKKEKDTANEQHVIPDPKHPLKRGEAPRLCRF